MPLEFRLEWAMLAHELEKLGLSQKEAERRAFRAVEPEPKANNAKKTTNYR